jgi:hypothetical protein
MTNIKLVKIKDNLSKKNYKNLLTDNRKVNQLLKKRKSKKKICEFIYNENKDNIPKLPDFIDQSNTISKNDNTISKKDSNTNEPIVQSVTVIKNTEKVKVLYEKDYQPKSQLINPIKQNKVIKQNKSESINKKKPNKFKFKKPIHIKSRSSKKLKSKKKQAILKNKSIDSYIVKINGSKNNKKSNKIKRYVIILKTINYIVKHKPDILCEYIKRMNRTQTIFVCNKLKITKSKTKTPTTILKNILLNILESNIKVIKK